MSRKIVIPALAIFLIVIPFTVVKGQELNIKGDTIYVNAEAEIQIKFPTRPGSFNTVPTNAEYSIKGEQTSVIMIARAENTKPASLLVAEGKRNHHFILVFKKDIDYSDERQIFYDYGTEKKLQNHIEELASRKAVKEEKPALTTTAGEVASNENTVQKENDKKYDNIISSANIYLGQKKYEQAGEAYRRALDMKPGDVYATNQLETIRKLLPDESAQKEKQKSNDLYLSYITRGEKAYSKNQFAEAKIAYQQALAIRPNDLLATSRLKLIERKENAQKQVEELENNYNTAIRLADAFYKAEDYDSAKFEYTVAIGFIKKPYPEGQLKKINKLLADKVLNESREKQKAELQLTHEAEITAKYAPIIKSADLEFDKNNYVQAKKLYAQAASLKPGEPYPKERIQLIDNITTANAAELKAKNDSIARGKELSRKYNVAIAQGKSNYLKNDFLKASIFYEEAMKLEPSEKEPVEQLKIINDRLEDIAKENESNTRYERTLNLADSQLSAKAYDSALNTYSAALKLKPSEQYPKTQIKYIQSELAGIERQKEVIKRQKTEQRYHDDLVAADKAVAGKRYEDAFFLYTEALRIHPDNEYAAERLRIISYQLEKMRSEKQHPAGIKTAYENPSDNVAPKAEKMPRDEHLVFQANPLPYSNEELKSKYPNINFSSLPPEQPFNKLAFSSKNNLNMYDSLVSEKPRLGLSVASSGVKMIVEAIGFEGTTAYVKVLIQNNSAEDFLTGAMMLTWTRETGNHIKLYPGHLYPSPLPVIKPGYEAAVIYVCKTYNVLDGEALTFDLIDRFQKIKLQVNIPGTAYNHEWAR